jgi:hypothetical protein
VGVEGVNREGKGGQIWSKYFVYLHESKIMKLVELRRGNDGGGKLVKVHCKHLCKYHNESPQYNYSMLIQVFFKNKNYKF